MSQRQLRGVDLAAALVTLALLVVVGLGVTGLTRILLALTFVTVVPGWAVIGHSKMVQGISGLALAVALSLTSCAAAALAMAWLRSWHPIALFYGLGGVTLLALLWKAAGPPDTVESPRIDEPVVRARPVPAAPHLRSEPRRLTLPPENLRLTSVSARVVFPPRSPFAPHELAAFFAGVHELHPFESFHLDGDAGAVMETSGCRLRVARDGFEYHDAAPARFQHAKQDVVDLLGEVQSRLGVAFVANPSYRLQAHGRPGSDDSDGAVPSRLFARVSGVDPVSYDLLGSTGPVEVGLRFAGESGEPRHTWRLMLEPHGDDDVVLDLTTEYLLPIEDPEVVGEHLQQAHRFLTDNVVRFVESLVDSTPGGQ